MGNEKDTNAPKLNPLFHILLGLCIAGMTIGIIFFLLSFKVTYEPMAVKAQEFTTYEPEQITNYVQKLDVQIEAGSHIETTVSLADTESTDTENKEEYIFEDSNQRKLEESEVSSLSEEQLRLARNEIYARLGRKFSDEVLQNYFNSKSWYSPQYSPEEFDDNGDSIFNEYELYNKNLISRVEKKLGYK